MIKFAEVSKQKSNKENQDDRTLLEKKIFAGTGANITNIPYQGAIEENGKLQCGCTMIHFSWFASAGHCYVGLKNIEKTVKIRIGTSFKGKGGTVCKIKRVVVYPDFNATTRKHDISLTQVTDPVELDKTKAFIPIFGPDALIFPGVLVQISGFGTKKAKVPTAVLRKVELRVLSEKKCAQTEPPGKYFNNLFCAGYKKAGSCPGDSGGPAVINQKLAGIITEGGYCSGDGIPTVMIQISFYYFWIKNTTRNVL